MQIIIIFFSVWVWARGVYDHIMCVFRGKSSTLYGYRVPFDNCGSCCVVPTVGE